MCPQKIDFGGLRREVVPRRRKEAFAPLLALAGGLIGRVSDAMPPLCQRATYICSLFALLSMRLAPVASLELPLANARPIRDALLDGAAASRSAAPQASGESFRTARLDSVRSQRLSRAARLSAAAAARDAPCTCGGSASVLEVGAESAEGCIELWMLCATGLWAGGAPERRKLTVSKT